MATKTSWRWRRTLKETLSERKFEFPLARAVYLATPARLFFPGSDRWAMARARDYQILGEGELSPHHLCRAMSLLGEARKRIEDDSSIPNAQGWYSKGPQAHRGGETA